MTKQIRSTYETFEISSGTPIRDIPAMVLEWLNKFGEDAKTDNYIEVEIRYEREETDAEYKIRVEGEQRSRERELRMLENLIKKYGVPENAR